MAKNKKSSNNPIPKGTRRPRVTARALPMHPSHRRFGTCVINPWSAPLAKGLSGDPSAPDTSVVRRKSVVSVDLSAGLVNGAEFAIVMNGRRNPYIAAWNGTAVTYYGRELEDDGLIPLDSYARVVSSGVQIRYTSSEQNRGGVWHHFSYDRDKSDSPAMAAFKNWGSLVENLEHAVSDTRMPPSGTIGFIDSPEVGFGRVTAQAADLLDAGMPASETDTSLMRLAYSGSPAGCVVEFHIAEVLEYYHINHAAYASGPTIVPHGDSVHQGLNSMLSIKGSQNSIVKPSLMAKVTDTINTATGIMTSVAGAFTGAVNAYGAYARAFPALNPSSTVTFEEVGEEALMLL